GHVDVVAHLLLYGVFFFFFQAEDGIRDRNVTGVQTCALPISPRRGAGGGSGPGSARACAGRRQTLRRTSVRGPGDGRLDLGAGRSEERRVGKEGRWARGR